jgi:hypothetical protein
MAVRSVPHAGVPDTSNRFRHTNDQKDDARRDEDECSPPDGQADDDRNHSTDEPAPREVHKTNIASRAFSIRRQGSTQNAQTRRRRAPERLASI